jgi:DNA adenine methylase
MKPFLKWAGGKYKIIDKIVPALPCGQRLIEPFVGSGAVFMNTDYPAYVLCDLNPDLIALYNCIKHEGLRFIDAAEGLFTPDNNTAEAYYALRTRFNESHDPRERSALFI